MKKLGRVELHMMLEHMRVRTSSDRYRQALKQAENALNAAHDLRVAVSRGEPTAHAMAALNELYRPVDPVPYTCPRCGQGITDGLPCGCGAR